MRAPIVAKPFRESHADLFESSGDYERQFKASIPMLAQLGAIDQCSTHIVDGRILVIAGYMEIAPGVAELFIYPSKYAREYRRDFYSEVKFCVQHLKALFRRVQCAGEETELSRRWLTKLGFVYEGTLRSYTVDGSNMTIWGIV